MKSLDEVIKAYEQCAKSDWEEGCGDCAYRNEKCGSCKCVRNDDALHYLKEYRKLDSLDAIAFREDADNDPLTWDELKEMVDKPVWIEDNIDEPEDTTKYWAIYRRIDKADNTEYALLSELFYDKAQYGETWQAYRKKRNENA